MAKVTTPSLKMWWIIEHTGKQKRWIVKNLKQFLEIHSGLDNTTSYYHSELDNMYRGLLVYHYAYGGWRMQKPRTVEELYNILGTHNLSGSHFKGKFYEEIPYVRHEFLKLKREGKNLTENFWKDFDFTI